MTLLGTYKLTANTQSFSEDRHMHESFLQEGVVGAGDYKVTPGGASLQWSVATGVAWVQGDTTARQGLYPQVNATSAVTGTVAAGHATLPRIDQVILQIADSSVTGASNTPTLSTLAGTATAGATLDNRTGAAALPASALRLADILVPAAHSGTISAANIRDRRKWARGAFSLVEQVSGADYTTSSTSDVELDATNIKKRIECSGVPVRLSIWAAVSNTASASVQLVPYMDSAPALGTAGHMLLSVSNSFANGHLALTFTPPAGSHTFSWYWRVSAGAGTIQRGTDYPVVSAIEEIVRQNASND